MERPPTLKAARNFFLEHTLCALDQKIWASPSAKAKFRKVAKLGTKDFTVTDSNWNNDELWLQVEFSEQVNCDWEELSPVLAKGWIRAYSSTEEMQLWFHPRLNC